MKVEFIGKTKWIRWIWEIRRGMNMKYEEKDTYTQTHTETQVIDRLIDR